VRRRKIKSTPKRVWQRKEHKEMMAVHGDRSAKYIRSKGANPHLLSSSMSVQTAAILAQAMIPYAGPLVRVRIPSNCAVTTATALARNFVQLEVNLAATQTASATPDNNPILQTLAAQGVQVWQNLATSYSLIQIHDPYLLGILPMVGSVGGDKYACNTFWGERSPTLAAHLSFLPTSLAASPQST